MPESKLLEQIAAPENLLAAWRAVRGNIPGYRRARSAGPDGVSLAEFERELPAQLQALRAMLLEGRYRPEPPAVFALPKKGGGQRRISVLTVRERVAQRAAQQVLEPLWEPLFLDCSFGFRPGLSTQHAVLAARQLRAAGYAWVVDGDIAACFDSLDHRLLLQLVERRMPDGRVLRLLEAWVQAGALQAGPPAGAGAAPPAASRELSGWLQRGLEWAAETALDEPGAYGYGADPYAAGRYEEAQARPGDAYFPQPAPYAPHSPDLRRRAFQRMLASGLIWAAGWARPAAASLAYSARAVLASPDGRKALLRVAAAGGGLAAVAAAGAAAVYLLQQRGGGAPRPAGVLQGSPLSPLLSNIYLHPFDQALTRRKHCLVRFADDWLVLCPTQEAAEAAYNDAYQALARLKLKLNAQKTRILPPGEALEWLGQSLPAAAGLAEEPGERRAHRSRRSSPSHPASGGKAGRAARSAQKKSSQG